MLALPWRKFNISFSGKEFIVCNKPILLQEGEITSMDNAESQTGTTIWDGAIVLSKYLEKRFGPGGIDEGKLVNAIALELGCGTGLVGICIAALGTKHVIVTDLNTVLENTTRKNLELNKTICNGICHTIPLNWLTTMQENKLPTEIITFLTTTATTKSSSLLELIVMADVFWVESLIEPLVCTLRMLVDTTLLSSFLHNNKKPTIILAHQTRSTRLDQLMFKTFQQYSFETIAIESRDEFFPEFIWEPIGHIFQIQDLKNTS
jgi:predicted nicotinamide N-methyase